METGLNFSASFNRDDVFMRCFIIAVRKFFNEKIYISYYKDNTLLKQNIPFFFNLGGSERFLQEIFLADVYDDQIEEKMVESNIDQIPRGIFTINSADVNSSELTNRFIPGSRLIFNEATKQFEKITSNLNLIPLTIPIELSIETATKIDVYRIWQKLLEVFYKMAGFSFMWQGSVISVYIGLPESVGVENKYEFTFGDITNNVINFSVECATYIPVFDEDYFNFGINQKMETIQLNITDNILPDNLSKDRTSLYSVEDINKQRQSKDKIITSNDSLSESSELRTQILKNKKD